MKPMLWCAIFVISGALASPAQAVKLPESWEKLAAKADEVVKVNMDRKMIQFASKFMEKEEDFEGKQLISKLNGIYVRSLQFKKPGAYAQADVEPIRAQLRGPEWSHIVEVDNKPQKEHVEIYVKTVGTQTMGMVILSQEPTELTLVHLDGPINPEDLDQLSGNFGIPSDLHVGKNKVTGADGSTKVRK